VQQKFHQHQLDGVAALAGAWYQGRPALQAWQDNNNLQLFSGRTVYLHNYRSNSSPQLAAGAAYRYNGRKAWFVSLASNYFSRQFVEVNPDRRTTEAVEKYVTEESQLSEPIIAQQQLPPYLVMNFSAGKLLRVKKKNLANINLSVLNLFNNTVGFVSAYEQLRWTPQTMGLFPPKYLHQQGRSFLLTTSFTF
jgi:hypothetical protein